jgi:anti-sigma factor RsiW
LSCELVQTTVHGYFDGELDAVRAADFERHLAACPECQASLERMASLRTRLQQSDLYEHASPHFREKLHRQLDIPRVPGRRTFSLPRFWIPAFALLALATGFAFFLGSSRAQSAQVTAELIDAHVRSLQPGHLTDVQSTDQHTVKPWFDGKLDFIPPVSDYSQQGFPLLGGRLDIVDGHNVAGLVYGRRKHFINLFVWPARGTERYSDNSGTRQGYHWTMWQSGDMHFCLVSDASPADLQQLRNLVH